MSWKRDPIFQNVPWFPQIVTRFPEIVTQFLKNVTWFPKIYDKLYNKKVLGILTGGPVFEKCDLVSHKGDIVS